MLGQQPGLRLQRWLWPWLCGRGRSWRSKEEVEDVEEDEDKEEVVVLGDVVCPAMRAGVALRAGAASAAASAGRMEDIFSACG